MSDGRTEPPEEQPDDAAGDEVAEAMEHYRDGFRDGLPLIYQQEHRERAARRARAAAAGPVISLPPPPPESVRAQIAERFAHLSRRRHGGKKPWDGSYFADAEDFRSAAVEALSWLHRQGRRLTRNGVLDWLADNRSAVFRRCEESRISEWCQRAGVTLSDLKRRALAEHRGRIPYSQEADREGS
jgi:hypothetical protein